MDLGEHDFESRTVFHVWHGTDRNATTIVNHGATAVTMNFHNNDRGIAVAGFVDAVGNEFEDEVVQSMRIGSADVHVGTEPNSFDPFERLNLRLAVFDVLVT